MQEDAAKDGTPKLRRCASTTPNAWVALRPLAQEKLEAAVEVVGQEPCASPHSAREMQVATQSADRDGHNRPGLEAYLPSVRCCGLHQSSTNLRHRGGSAEEAVHGL